MTHFLGVTCLSHFLFIPAFPHLLSSNIYFEDSVSQLTGSSTVCGSSIVEDMRSIMYLGRFAVVDRARAWAKLCLGLLGKRVSISLIDHREFSENVESKSPDIS